MTTLIVSAIVRQWRDLKITLPEAIKKYGLTDLEEQEIIVILKSMEHYHG